MDLRGFLQVLWRRLPLMIVVVAIIVGVAAWSLSTQPEVYESRAKVALLPDSTNPQLVPFYSQAVESLLPTYAEIIDSVAFLDQVAAALPFDTTGAELRGDVRGAPVARIGVLDVVARSEVPLRAQQIAETTAQKLTARLAGNGLLSVTLLDDARLPTEPVSPRPELVLGVAVVVALAAAIGAAVAWDRFFGRVRSRRDVTDLDLPLLGVIPETRALRERRLVVGNPDLAAMEESLRTLRTNLMYAGLEDDSRTILVTGLGPGDGKSTVAANLAIVTAELGISVLLVDADIFHPVQHELFGLTNDRGLTSMITSDVTPESMPIATRHPNLRVVPAGPPVASRADALHIYLNSLRDLGTLAEVVIIDSPPLAAADEVRILASFCSRVVLLVRSGRATTHQLEQAVDSVKRVGGHLQGIVLTRVRGGDAPDRYTYQTYRAPVPDEGRRRARRGRDRAGARQL